jgi:hypothetical protein
MAALTSVTILAAPAPTVISLGDQRVGETEEAGSFRRTLASFPGADHLESGESILPPCFPKDEDDSVAKFAQSSGAAVRAALGR